VPAATPIQPNVPAANVAASGTRATPAPAAAAPAVVGAGTGDAVAVADRAGLDWRAPAAVLWLGGVLLVVTGLAWSVRAVAALRRAAAPVTDPAWLALLAAVRAELGVRRDVALMCGTGATTPLTCGVWRPAVVLPRECATWTPERRRDVLRHELAHVRRHDVLTQLAARVVCGVYWFNPFCWLAARAMRIERERACDDAVLNAGGRPSEYAASLLDLARTARPRLAESLAGVAMARPSQLAGRLLDVLDARRARTSPSGRQRALAAALAGLVIGPLGAVSLVAAREPLAVARDAPLEQRPVDPERRSVPRRATSAARAAAAPTVATSPDGWLAGLVADTLPECSGTPRRVSSHGVHVNDGTAVNVVVGRCRITCITEGEVRFSDAFTDIESVTDGGSVVLETDNGEVTRRLEIRGGERRYQVDGRDQPYDAAARRWVAGALTLIFRSTGYQAEARSRWIVQRQGVEALFDELRELSGDYARRVYALAALTSARDNPRLLERLLTWAGGAISSDYELAELLVAVAAQPLPPAAQGPLVAALGSIRSDYELRRVMTVILARGQLTPEASVTLLDVAASIDSDYELAELLIHWQHAERLDAGSLPGFLRAAATLGSDYERRRVLHAAVGAPAAGDSLLARVLELAGDIGSDYELAELLVGVASRSQGAGHSSAVLRPPFFRAVASLASDYERRRVLDALVQDGALDEAWLADVLSAARPIGSDYERAELLVAVAQRHTLTGDVRTAYLALANGIGSRYEQDRALAALTRGELNRGR
jgi:beta-lactamase regulating signal transducer with metallopeptidase domain